MTNPIEIICLPLSHPEPTGEEALTKDDVWGKYDMESHKRLSEGMIIARTDDICPHFNDKLGYKDVTVRGPKSKASEISYWLEYVHGSDCVTKVDQDETHIFIRSEYQCW